MRQAALSVAHNAVLLIQNIMEKENINAEMMLFTSKLKPSRSHRTHTVGKISIEYVTIFLSKYISKGAADMKFSTDVGNNPSNPYIQTKQNK